jgi:hypothetical protein
MCIEVATRKPGYHNVLARGELVQLAPPGVPFERALVQVADVDAIDTAGRSCEKVGKSQRSFRRRLQRPRNWACVLALAAKLGKSPGLLSNLRFVRRP